MWYCRWLWQWWGYCRWWCWWQCFCLWYWLCDIVADNDNYDDMEDDDAGGDNVSVYDIDYKDNITDLDDDDL